MKHLTTQLTREVRFHLSPDASDTESPVQNSWAGWPKTMLLAPFVTVRATLSGPVNETGYIADVKRIDHNVRDVCLPLMLTAASRSADTLSLVKQLFEAVSQSFTEPIHTERLQLQITPYQSLTVSSSSPQMTIVTQQFEFSAAHRLHCDSLSDEENQKLFGKCNNPNGHGHNYVLEISVSTDCSEPFDLHNFEAIVVEHAVRPFDHKHLNEDVDDFRDLNPTVENIANVVWSRLTPHVQSLQRVRVFETPKTWADVERA
ncbi:MAG: 6-carboxytetrahydropterin synthase [Planctomycetaceae bacterium]